MKDMIKKMINDHKANTIISYIDENGFPISKAMLKPRLVEDEKVFYFSTNTSSNKVHAYEKHHIGSIYMFNPSTFIGVSLIGQVEILKDIDIKTKIWLKGDEKFYPLGIEDPDYCVLRFTVTHGRAYLTNRNQDFQLS